VSVKIDTSLHRAPDATRGIAPNGRYDSHYCANGEAMEQALLPPGRRVAYSTITVHDRRGCYHLCWPHAHWRSTTSMIGGHSDDCPHKGG
jgi:hypothetical protein